MGISTHLKWLVQCPAIPTHNHHLGLSEGSTRLNIWNDFHRAKPENRVHSSLCSSFDIPIPTISILSYSHRVELRLNLSIRLTELFSSSHKCLISSTTFSNQALIMRSQERHFILNKSKYWILIWDSRKKMWVEEQVGNNKAGCKKTI